MAAIDSAPCANHRRIAFLRERIANAQRVLAAPNVRYPNGRMSHDAHRQSLLADREELEDLLLAAPKHADGTLAEFAS